jgi:hypothetical protein
MWILKQVNKHPQLSKQIIIIIRQILKLIKNSRKYNVHPLHI